MKFLWVLVTLFVTLFAEDNALQSLFDKNHLGGTILIESLDGKESYVFNEKRAQTPLLPASTFKIPNTLIALDKGIVTAQSSIIWDKVERSFPAWNQDQTLQSAFRNSCVWCYQLFARQVGLDAYKSYLKTLHYGNETPGSDLENFWLDGDLRITAYQQIDFLKRLYSKNLPFKDEHLELLKTMMLDEQTAKSRIYAKTGWATPKDLEHHGWYVGYIESPKGVYLFATNLVIPSSDVLPWRKKVTLEALKSKGILE